MLKVAQKWPSTIYSCLGLIKEGTSLERGAYKKVELTRKGGLIREGAY